MEMLRTKGVTRRPTYGKRINVSVDPLDESSKLNVLAIPNYDYLEHGSKKVRITLQNNSREVVKIMKGMAVA